MKYLERFGLARCHVSFKVDVDSMVHFLPHGTGAEEARALEVATGTAEEADRRSAGETGRRAQARRQVRVPAQDTPRQV